MDSIWSVDGISVRVELTPQPPGWSAHVNGKAIGVASFQPGRLVLTDGRVFDYAADWVQSRQQAVINHGGESLVAVRQGNKQASASAAAGGLAVAPMSGQVTKIHHLVGEKVESGQVILVLEAMKMENEVVAPGVGILKAIHVLVGENVAPGQKLFDIEAVDL